MEPLARWMNSAAVSSRLAQSLSLMKAMPAFSPEPMKLKPVTCSTPSTAGSLFRISRICVITAEVRCLVAPGGSWITDSA